ncbi:hypothetical protein, partial [Kitasatospora sp. SC0581]|uniref:hypothetical protein n=1 Tax=Kitasatospora sp. SC0581 TaxID=3394360 RepID=UPI003A89BE2A
MSVELDIPEFPHEEPPGEITCRQKPWNGVLVRVNQIPFKAGDKLTFDVTVRSDFQGQTPAAAVQGVVNIAADSRRQPGGAVCGPDSCTTSSRHAGGRSTARALASAAGGGGGGGGRRRRAAAAHHRRHPGVGRRPGDRHR